MSNSSTLEVLKSLESNYLNKRYDETFKLFLQHKHIFSKGAYHYNLGTIFAQKADYAIARYHFEKSIQNGFLEKMVFYNLNSVKHNLKLEKNTSLAKYEHLIFKSKNLPDAAFFSMTLLTLLFFILIFRKKITKIKYFILFLALSSIPFFYNKVALKKYNQGIVLKDSIVKEGPSAIYNAIKKVKAGTRVMINKSHNGQHYVILPEKYEGWINIKDIGIY